MSWQDVGLVLMGGLMGGAYVALFATAERWRREASRLAKELRPYKEAEPLDVTVVNL